MSEEREFESNQPPDGAAESAKAAAQADSMTESLAETQAQKPVAESAARAEESEAVRAGKARPADPHAADDVLTPQTS